MNTGICKPKAAPTEVQMKALLAIHQHIKRTGISPSYDELTEILSVTKTAVWQAIGRLRRDGFLEAPARSIARYRNLSLTPAGLRVVRQAERTKAANAA